MNHMDYILLEWEMEREIKLRRRAARIENMKTAAKAVTLVLLFVICFVMAWFWGEANDAHAEGLNRIRNGVAPIIVEEPEPMFSEEEEWILLHVGMAEAGNQGPEGIALVMNVICNRCAAGFGTDMMDVVTRPHQFSTVQSGSWLREPNEDCYTALEMVENGWDESQGALYFRTSNGTFSWATYLFTYGGHNFYR